ncbi:hypothetical protein F5879DRAFT_532092 [Lentinula edodes]|uniref:uncharacterized protein n=1 Tax=Lentinula edodes TaxID=5353 RepID=UPI001E8EE796|nr:uncharacterized protein C8R40DRAFT_1033149 [Lentinula edodes]KAH7880732.1 hypothetical protein C8R40DRAFT_1033149 [Lentinula edodes]KAJ3907380.1 hypothetical protein F5879DRAFT_532092 [Lentinula edodes]
MDFNPNDILEKLPELSDDLTHPSQVAIRTFALSLSLSLGPSLVPFVLSFITGRRSQKTGLAALRKVLRRELGYDSFASAVTLAIGGGAALKRLWESLEVKEDENFEQKQMGSDRCSRSWLLYFNSRLSSCQKTFIANLFTSSISILLLQAGRRRSERLRNIPRPGAIPFPYTYTPSNPSLTPSVRSPPSPTLDLTLLVLVRAIDVAFQSMILKFTSKTEAETPEPVKGKRNFNKDKFLLTTRLDALVFWACSARIMWCFFYQPERLPSTYVKWIRTLAGVDNRLLRVLRLIRSGEWTYTRGSPTQATLLTTYAKDLGYPSSWGDPLRVPAFGGPSAERVWELIGVKGRHGLGGVPCELVHGGVGSKMSLAGSCTGNSSIRGVKAFFEAVLVYLPAHFLPVLITRPQVLLRPHRVLSTFLATCRSAAFLSAFISSFWLSVCFTRTLALARLFPNVSHDFWDGPHGCILAGCLMCGSSIWLENGRRRGEMALYVLPRAIRACIPDKIIRSRNRVVTALERLTFVLSLSTLLTAAIHKPESLRGLSRWGLAFIMKGPHAGFWQRRKKNFETRPGTPEPVASNDNIAESLH